MDHEVDGDESSSSIFRFIPNVHRNGNELVNDGGDGSILAGDGDDFPSVATVATEDNELLRRLDPSFLSDYQLPRVDISVKLRIVQAAFEDPSVAEEELVAALRYRDFSLTSFILSIMNSELDIELDDTSAKCLAFAGSIYPNLWNEFCEKQHRLLMVLRACQVSCSRIDRYLRLSKVMRFQGKLNTYKDAYVGYDARDKEEYGLEGYDEVDNSEHASKASVVEDNMRINFLFLFQIFSQPLRTVFDKVAVCRSKPITRRSVRKSILYDAPLLISIEKSLRSTEGGAAASLDSIDWIHFYTDLSRIILECTADLSDDLHIEAIKLITVVGLQLPPMRDRLYNEVLEVFAQVDAAQESQLTHSLLHYLNDNGYPRINEVETTAAIEFCYCLMHLPPLLREDDESNGVDDQQLIDQSTTGYFYTNDIKVLVDLIVRELSNIPPLLSTGNGDDDNHEAAVDGRVRQMYLKLLDVVIGRSSWSSHGASYMRDAIKHVLEGIAQRMDDDAQPIAEQLLIKYDDLLS